MKLFINTQADPANALVKGIQENTTQDLNTLFWGDVLQLEIQFTDGNGGVVTMPTEAEVIFGIGLLIPRANFTETLPMTLHDGVYKADLNLDKTSLGNALINSESINLVYEVQVKEENNGVVSYSETIAQGDCVVKNQLNLFENVNLTVPAAPSNITPSFSPLPTAPLNVSVIILTEPAAPSEINIIDISELLPAAPTNVENWESYIRQSEVTGVGQSYFFSGSAYGYNPNMYLYQFDTLRIVNNSGGHPMVIEDLLGNTIATEQNGVLEHWFNLSGSYVYKCQTHPTTMTGSITVEPYWQPIKPSDVETNEIINYIPTKPGDIVIDKSPTKPSNINVQAEPAAPSNIILYQFPPPAAPSNVTITELLVPAAPSNVVPGWQTFVVGFEYIYDQSGGGGYPNYKSGVYQYESETKYTIESTDAPGLDHDAYFIEHLQQWWVANMNGTNTFTAISPQGQKKIFPLFTDTRMTTQNVVYVSSPPLAPSDVVMNEMPKPNAPQLITSVQQIPPQLSIDGTNYPHETTQQSTIHNLQPNKTLVFNNPQNERHEQQAYFQTSAAVNDPNYQHIQKPADKWRAYIVWQDPTTFAVERVYIQPTDIDPNGNNQLTMPSNATGMTVVRIYFLDSDLGTEQNNALSIWTETVLQYDGTYRTDEKKNISYRFQLP